MGPHCSEPWYRFTSDSKYDVNNTMIAYSGRRSEESNRIMEQIRNQEWGLLLMDEVHVVPAQMFRKVGNVCSLSCQFATRQFS